MAYQNFARLALAFSFAASLLVPVMRAQAQDSQSDSVADAARKARAQKKPSDKPAPVITDDILKPSNATAVPPGSTASADANANSSAAAAGQGNSADANKPEGSGDKQKADEELASLKQQVEEAQKSLDLAKRELALEQDNLYSKPDYQNDRAGKSKVDGLTQQAADKQQVLDDLKARLAELQSKVPAAAPSPEAPPSAPPQL